MSLFERPKKLTPEEEALMNKQNEAVRKLDEVFDSQPDKIEKLIDQALQRGESHIDMWEVAELTPVLDLGSDQLHSMFYFWDQIATLMKRFKDKTGTDYFTCDTDGIVRWEK